MRIFWVGGDQPRHLYYINELAKHFEVVGGIMQVRESMPTVEMCLAKKDKDNMDRHFWDRKEAEERYFGDQKKPDFPYIKVSKDELNSVKTAKYAHDTEADLGIVFGCGMIRHPLYEYLPKDTINLHLGLSPRYRGAATLFWPFYFLEPNWAGCTFHYLVDTPDGGDIIHQVVPEMKTDDGIHDLSARAVLQATTEAHKLFKIKHRWVKHPQKPEAGKNFLESDFKPQHLRMIYNSYNNDIVKHYMNGDLKPKPVVLKRQFP